MKRLKGMLPARAIVIPVVLIGAGLIWQYAPGRKAPPAQPSRLDDLVPNPEGAAPDHVVSSVEDPPPAPPAVDIVPELVKIGQRAMKTLPSQGDGNLLAPAACTRLTAKERAAMRAKLATWIDHTYATERADAVDGLDVQYGCRDADGVIVAAHVDRGTKARRTMSRWWVLRVTDSISVLSERTSSATETWMEWAQEGSLDVLALADLDGDGKRDILFTLKEHEGGSNTSDWDVRALLATGERKMISSHGVLDAIPQDGRVVLALGNTEHWMYRCIEKDLALTTCPAAVAVHHHQDVFELGEKYSALTAATALPDREQLVDDLTKLGVSAPDRTRLAASAPETTPQRRAQHHLDVWVAQLDADDDLAAIQGQPHAVAATYFGSLRGQLGDTSCAPVELTKPDRDRIFAWLDAQPRAKKTTRPPEGTSVSAVCGAYAWIGWDELPASGGEGVHRETLLALDPALTRVTTIKTATNGDPTSSHSNHQDLAFKHGATVVVAILHDDQVDVVANNKVAGTRKGALESYLFDARWPDASDDLLFDPAAHTYYHPTPTGLEKIDREPMQAHEIHRAALELVRATPVANTKPFMQALARLGAPMPLVKLVMALPPA